MSTRSTIIVTDNSETLYFYRHSDGYPKSVMPILNKLIDQVKSGKLRDNTSQFSGWLIIEGQKEMDNMNKLFSKDVISTMDWKSSTIEPIGYVYEDSEYIYTVDLENKTVKYQTHEEYNSIPAISRVDNKTEVCSECGTLEALTTTVKDVNKKEAKKLKDIMTKLGHDIPIGHAYEVLARMNGFKDHNTAKAKELLY